jgi:type II restriction enzyme
MNKLCKLLNISSDEELFKTIVASFKDKITQWDYFVNWKKVMLNIQPIEVELNILNSLIGKDDIQAETYSLIKQYPQIIKAIPILLAIRENSVNVLIDTKQFIYQHYNFSKKQLIDEDYISLAEFVVNSGIGVILKEQKIKNLVDYATGVEVGLDSNGRKNRGGDLMERIVEDYVLEMCNKLKIPYLRQANASKIKAEWGVEVLVDKSSRIIDFAINKNGKLYFIECNFYGGGGSKLKSTATEYIELNKYWNEQGIVFIWVTDGAGWLSTLRPLREYFDKADYLLNLELLNNGAFSKIFMS